MSKSCSECKYLEYHSKEDYSCWMLHFESWQEDRNELAVTSDYEAYASDLVIKDKDLFYCALFEQKAKEQ